MGDLIGPDNQAYDYDLTDLDMEQPDWEIDT